MSEDSIIFLLTKTRLILQHASSKIMTKTLYKVMSQFPYFLILQKMTYKYVSNTLQLQLAVEKNFHDILYVFELAKYYSLNNLIIFLEWYEWEAQGNPCLSCSILVYLFQISINSEHGSLHFKIIQHFKYTFLELYCIILKQLYHLFQS